MRRGVLVRVVAVGLAAAAVAVAVALLVPWLPTPASKEADRIDFVFWFVTGICIAIFSLVAGVILYAVVRFRARPDDDSDGAPIHGHTGLEIAWTAVPAALVTAISVVSAVALAENDHLPKRHIRVNVTAQQFAWSFHYPASKNLTSGTLRVPVNRSVLLTFTSKDVSIRHCTSGARARTSRHTSMPLPSGRRTSRSATSGDTLGIVSIASAKDNFSLLRFVSMFQAENARATGFRKTRIHFIFGLYFQIRYGAVSQYM